MQTTMTAYEKAAQASHIRLRYADVAKHVVWPMTSNNNVQTEIAAVCARFANNLHGQQFEHHKKKATSPVKEADKSLQNGDVIVIHF